MILTTPRILLLLAFQLVASYELTAASPAIITWNVSIESVPAGADVYWEDESGKHPLGKAPVTANIPLMAKKGAFGMHYPRVRLYASLNGHAANSSPYENVIWRHKEATSLPSKVTIDVAAFYRFHDAAGLAHFKDYEKNPAMWSRYITSFKGKVQSIREASDGCVVSLYVEDAKRTVVIGWPKATMRGVVEGTYLKVLGNITGTTEGVNAFGAPVSMLTFLAYGYSANWFYDRTSPERVVTDYTPEKKTIFDKWADGTLFLGEVLVSAVP